MLLKSRPAHADDALAGFPGLKKPGPPEMTLSAAMDITSETPGIIEFGHFRVVPRRRELLADGQPIHLGGRSFDVLMALIEGQGGCFRQRRADGPRLAEPDRRGEQSARPDLGPAQCLRGGS